MLRDAGLLDEVSRVSYGALQSPESCAIRFKPRAGHGSRSSAQETLMYPHSGGNQWQQPIGYPVPQQAQRPPAVRNAVIVMYVGGGLEILTFIVDLIDGYGPSRSVPALIGAVLWFF